MFSVFMAYMCSFVARLHSLFEMNSQELRQIVLYKNEMNRWK